MSPWLRYTLLRLLFIVVPLVVLLILFGSLYWIYWVIASVIIGLALSYIFLKNPREAMAQELAARRNAKPAPTRDDADEDAEIEASVRADIADEDAE